MSWAARPSVWRPFEVSPIWKVTSACPQHSLSFFLDTQELLIRGEVATNDKSGFKLDWEWAVCEVKPKQLLDLWCSGFLSLDSSRTLHPGSTHNIQVCKSCTPQIRLKNTLIMVKGESWSKIVSKFWAKQMLDMSCMEAPWGFLFGLVLVTLIDCYRHNFLVCTPRVLMMISGGG